MKQINKKRTYVKPAMQVYELREEPRLLQSSNLDSLDPFNNPGTDPLNP